MKPGILLLGNVAPPRIIELARLAESVGFGDAWIADERFYREVYSYLSIVAAATTRIRLGTCVTDPYSRHPAMTAAAVATLDEISGGRALLGIGTGLSGLAEMGIERHRPVLAMREMVDLVRQLLKGTAVDFKGEVISFQDGRLNFTPLRADIPVYIASNGPLGLALAGKVADAAIMEGCGTPREAEVFVGRVRGAAKKAGRDPATIQCIARLNCCISDDSAAAHNLLRARAARTLTGFVTPLATLEEQGLALPATAIASMTGIPYKAGLAPYEKLNPLVSNQMVDAVTLAGTPREVADRISALRRCGIDGVIISPAAVAGDTVDRVIRRFAEEVWPAIDAVRRPS